jgi:ubiquinone/menaquinone biosynthesis C-methylase UbiE
MYSTAGAQAAKEFARVLKPGGKLFFVDSAQKGEVA